MAEPLLSVRNLTVEFTIRGGVVPVIDDLSFDLVPRETLSLVGESGCGKSMTALAIMGLVPQEPPVHLASKSPRFRQGPLKPNYSTMGLKTSVGPS